MIFLCIVDNANIYRYCIYLVAYIIVLILDTITLRKYAKSTYVNGVLLAIITMIIFTGECVTSLTIIITLLAIAIYLLLYKLKDIKNKQRKTDKQIAKEISIGFYLGTINITIFILVLLYNQYIL